MFPATNSPPLRLRASLVVVLGNPRKARKWRSPIGNAARITWWSI